ncbi:MAG TPA: O-antigen ligase family protein, partial [Solirubrobacterales bacterium]
MDATSMRPGAALKARVRGVDWGAAPTWLLGVGLVAYLGLKGGGYDPLVHEQVGIALWWVSLVAVLAGALPRRRLQPLAWVALGLLAVLALWTVLSLGWTESVDRSFREAAMTLTYLGAFALALGSRGRGEAGQLAGAVATGIVAVCAIALLSRLHPAWFPTGHETAAFLTSTRERLSYPLNYWNGLAALIAIGLPLLLWAASDAKSALLRGLAAAALPALILTLFFTLSRAGIAAAAIVLALYLALVSDRLPKLATLALGGAGGTVLIVAANQRDALQQGLLNEAARQQGNEVLAMTIVICLIVGAVGAWLSGALRAERRPRWAAVTRRQTLAVSAVAAVTVLVAALALDAPGRAADGWSEFKRGEGPGKGTGRLASAAGQSRYQLWAAAVRENESAPLTGTGAGTFEYWWARDPDVDVDAIVRDTHSLYFQTLGELGIVGLLQLAAFLALVLGLGVRAIARAGPGARSPLAAALAACVAFCIVAATDWIWQIPVLPTAFLLLGAGLVAEAGGVAGGEVRGALRLPLRLAFAPVALAAIVAIAIPLASTSLLRESQADARAGEAV